MSSIDHLAKSHIFRHITNCLSQAYGCSDHYTDAEDDDDVFATSTPVRSMQSNTTW